MLLLYLFTLPWYACNIGIGSRDSQPGNASQPLLLKPMMLLPYTSLHCTSMPAVNGQGREIIGFSGQYLPLLKTLMLLLSAFSQRVIEYRDIVTRFAVIDRCPSVV